MKIERLLSIIFYLLNRNIVSGQTLADHFNVSRRTILRDINTLTLAGIPIYTELGVNGGYAIHKDYQFNTKVINDDNSDYILQALVGLKMIYGEELINDTYEKVQHLFAKTAETAENRLIELNFSALSQESQVMTDVQELKLAIKKQRKVEFNYTNRKNQTNYVAVDPLHIVYMWYGWYLFGYSHLKKDYRLYKIIRIRGLKNSEQDWAQDYDVVSLWHNFELGQQEKMITIEIEYEKSIRILVEEYFKGQLMTETTDLLRTKVTIYDYDFMLFSLILGFGDKLKVLSPPAYVTKIKGHLEQTLNANYSNSDS